MMAKSRAFGNGIRHSVRVASAFLVLAWLAGVERVHSYEFLNEPLNLPPTIGPLGYWSPNVWAPGQTLPVYLQDSELWEEHFANLDQVRSFVEDGLRAWSRIDSADIQWTLVGVLPETEKPPEGALTVIVHDKPSYSFVSATASSEGKGVYATTTCVANMWRGHTSPFVAGGPLAALIHELGHCLGLQHPGVYLARTEHFGFREDGEAFTELLPAPWRADPVMSYGDKDYWSHQPTVSDDDRIGVSLARPAAGWIERTGSIAGRVLVDGAGAASHVHVLATQFRGGRIRQSVGRFTNRAGRFVIGGLDPGDYVLLVRPVITASAHSRLLRDAVLGIRDSYRAAPVTVVSGGRTGPIVLTVRNDDTRLH